MNANRTRRLIPIRAKLLAVALLLLAVPVTVLGAISYSVSVRETDKLIRSGLQTDVKLAIEMLASLDESVKNGSLTEEEAQEKFRRMILGPKDAEGHRPINKHFDLGENGYFFVLDDKGNLLAHPQLEGSNIWDKQTSDGQYYIRDLIQAAKAGGGFTTYSWPLPGSTKEAEKITYAQMAPAWGWIVAAGSYMQDYNAGQRHIVQTIVLTLAVCLACGTGFALLFAAHIAKPILRVARGAAAISEGDLSGEPIRIRNADEIGLLADSFNTMAGKIKQLVGNLLSGSETMAAASQNLVTVIQETKAALNQTTGAIAQVADNNEDQARSVQDTARAMEEMAAGVQRVADTSSGAAAAADLTLEAAENGGRLIDASASQMKAVSEAVEEFSAMVAKLHERSQHIGGIVDAISDIAAQTNLLALNASIEAARAGEDGKGFAVVAGEVRKLAIRSDESAAEAAGLIEAIQADIEATLESMRTCLQQVGEAERTVRDTGDAFGRILESTRSAADQVREASAAAEQMSAGTEQISAALNGMESLSQQTADAAQTVSASSEEQLASMEEVAAAAESLGRLAEDLRNAAEKFKLR